MLLFRALSGSSLYRKNPEIMKKNGTAVLIIGKIGQGPKQWTQITKKAPKALRQYNDEIFKCFSSLVFLFLPYLIWREASRKKEKVAI